MSTQTTQTTRTTRTTPPGEFRNEPFVDFTDPSVRERQGQAIADVRAGAGRTYDLIIGGERCQAAGTFSSLNPANPSEILGHFAKAAEAEAERAIQAARNAFPSWSRTSAEERAAVLFRAAELMRERRFECNAWMILEVGKSWPEADGDTAEAIDFLEFYGREMLRYGAEQDLTPVKGEKNELLYIPLGVGIIIPPWNFPNAILCGMSSAAVVTGNTIVLKPSSDSPGIAHVFVDIMEKAGAPAGVINLLTGPGAVAGDFLVRHSQTRFVAFTGSKEVGLGINAKAAQTPDGQIWIKRVIAEMGGKDAIIVAADADLDEAVEGVVASAFGYQGQKCSACSRAIVDDAVYDDFVGRVVALTAKLTVGPTDDPDNEIGAVVNERAMDDILGYIEVGKKEGTVVCGGNRADGDGYFIEPTVIRDVDSRARIAQEEIFGPVLAVIRAKGFDDALAIANGTEYGLTGSVYTASEENVEKARREFHVGNLYFNRKCTGAFVGAHPFGGFNMSGTDSKAGGRDYLLLFLQAKSVSRKLS